MSRKGQTEYEKWATDRLLDDLFEMECLHCDAVFSDSYVRWHFARRKPDGTAVLTCRECGCWTPVRFEIGNEHTAGGQGPGVAPHQSQRSVEENEVESV